MEYRTLGRTGLRVSAVALGCEGFMHKRAEEVKADFDFAIRHGINFVDIYSSNPDLRANLGAALEGRRGEFIIQGHLCTVWENDQYLRTRDPEKSLAAFEDMLARLGTDYVEIGMIHYVDAAADLREVLAGTTIDESRILTEAAIFADRIAVDEETVRLHSHILGMKKILNEQEGVGRKMDFMAQEMNREANTILSKSSDLEVSDIAIGLKTEIEKIREQIQNIE